MGTQERSTTSRRKDGVAGLVDATGSSLECRSFADGRIKIPLGRPDTNSDTLIHRIREDFTETRLYSTIKDILNKTKDYFNRARVYLTDISRYLPR